MPLNSNDIVSISQWFMKHSPQGQIIHSLATAMPPNADFQEQWVAACEMWAIRGLQGNMTTPVEVLTTIVMGRMEDRIRDVVDEVHDKFGTAFDYKVGPRTDQESWIRRHQHRRDLHRLTAAVFEYCLQSNGFVLQDSSDYMVCMEYEFAHNQAMYPNFTHAWLSFRDAFVVQTIPDHYISISPREAGRQPHCGFIRRGVTDFLPEQIAVVKGIIEDPVHCMDPHKTVQCAFPISSATDVLAPNE
ncbi:hypothetical protein ACFL6M_03540 [Candidatus Eisenbacteria bacterium]|uniref:Uncharacterized protein n=1 Tax=Eiseniibacteriota bacterium TaxID=2212470 RepID=A0ABV6YK19_UNCEI